MKNRTLLFSSTALLCALIARAKAADDIIIGDFEGADYGTWQATGTAFGPGPARGDLPRQLEVEAWRGNGIASSEREGDKPTGTLTSPNFKIARQYISFLVAGGNYEHATCVDLLIGGKVVRSATGWNSDRLVPVTWDVSQWRGQTAQVQLVDQASGDWGHINVDQVIQTDQPDHLPVNTGPLYQETHRPQFHFTARQWTEQRLNPGMQQEGWVNDLNGLIYYDGEYHLFAQRWAKCWLHAVSRDLVHWTELEPAFWEEQAGSGVQSGTCVIDYANTSGLSPNKATPPMIAFWPRWDNRSQCICYSLDHGRTWKRYEKNPVLVYPERDPKVFWYAPGQHWVMILSGENGNYNIFNSKNLLAWQNTNHPILNSYECPDMFELPVDGNKNQMKWVLIRGNGKYSVGSFDGQEFKEETPQFDSDSGPNFYATQTWANVETGDGRRVQAAWMRGGSYPDMPFNQQITFPRELTLRSTPQGPRLYREPVREIATLHGHEQDWANHTLNNNGSLPLAPMGELFHIQAQVSIPVGSTLTFHIRGVPVVLTHTTLANGTDPVPVADEIKTVEILVDRTSIETFANGGEISGSRCFISNENGMTLQATGGPVTIQSLKVFELKSAWPDNLAGH